MKNIAISQRELVLPNGMTLDGLEREYTEYYQKIGVNLIPVSNRLKNLKEYFSDLNIEGIILSGGNDISPVLYHGKKLEGGYSNARDNLEKRLLDLAIKDKIPVFGECRGMQFINVYFGGRLMQDISHHVRVEHEVEVTNENFQRLLGKKIITNSYHNHGISSSELSTELEIFAKSGRMIEGIYHPKFSIVGVMWHPERGAEKEYNKNLIERSLRL